MNQLILCDHFGALFVWLPFSSQLTCSLNSQTKITSNNVSRQFSHPALEAETNGAALAEMEGQSGATRLLLIVGQRTLGRPPRVPTSASSGHELLGPHWSSTREERARQLK